MGGMISFVARKENGATLAVKLSTWELDKIFNDPKIADESFLDKLLMNGDYLKDQNSPDTEHNNYESRKAVKAPYHYGLLLIDYKNKELLSANNYSSFLNTGTIKLLDDYTNYVVHDFMTKEMDSKGNISIVNLLERRCANVSSLYLINQTLSLGGFIEYKGSNFYGSLERVIENIFNFDFQNKSAQEKSEIAKKKINNNRFDDDIISEEMLSQYSDINLHIPNVKSITNMDKSTIECIYNYMKKNDFIFTEYEHQVWQEEIEDVKNNG